MGHVIAPYGVRGWIKVHTYTETVDALLDYPVWWLGKAEAGWRERRVAACGIHGKSVIAQLEGCDDRTAAAQLNGLQIAVPRSLLPETADNEFYWADLIGLKVVNLRGEELGTVTGLLESGANDVLQVKGESERLIPFIGPVIVEVSPAEGLIRVDWSADY